MSQPRVFERWSPVGRRDRQDYYVRRPDTGTRYSWSHTVDPDGRERNRLSEEERLIWVHDNRDLIHWLLARPAGELLDVGSGPGWVGREVAHHHQYTAVETAPEAIAALRREDLRHVLTIEDFEPDRFDIVLAYHVLEHMVSPESQVSEMHRVLCRGGHLVVGTPDFHSPCAVRFGANYRMLHDPTHISLFSLEGMARMLRDYGFTIENITFPFPERYATAETMARWCDTTQVSPPWPGNWMTFFCRK